MTALIEKYTRIDVHDVYTWIPAAEIKATKTDEDAEYNYKLENTYIDIVVKAVKTK